MGNERNHAGGALGAATKGILGYLGGQKQGIPGLEGTPGANLPHP